MVSSKKSWYYFKKTTTYKESNEYQCQEFREIISQYPKDNLVYVDESGIGVSYGRRFARSPKGQKVYGKISGKRIKRQSILAAQVNSKIIAPMIFEGTCYTELFEAWTEQCLCPELKPNQVVIMDNATFHKSQKTKELIESVGCKLLFLPPYSPHLNPIEQFWGVLKRKVAYLVSESISVIDCIEQILTKC